MDGKRSEPVEVANNGSEGTQIWDKDPVHRALRFPSQVQFPPELIVRGPLFQGFLYAALIVSLYVWQTGCFCLTQNIF